MNHDAQGPGKVKTGVTALAILLSGAGAGVYAYETSGSSAPLNDIAVDRECRQTMAADRQRALPAPAGKSDAMQRAAGRRYLMQLHEGTPGQAQASSNARSEQYRTLSDSDRKRFLVLLALWSIKS